MTVHSDSSLNRISALFIRYFYLLRSSWPRIIEIAYWPTMQMVVWGFVSKHFAPSSPEFQPRQPPTIPPTALEERGI